MWFCARTYRTSDINERKKFIMKRIGIITFHRATNYGAVLQTYALQQTLISMGMQNEVIDYHHKYIEKMSVGEFLVKKGIKGVIRKPLGYFMRKKRNDTFELFVENYLITSTRTFYYLEDLAKCESDYDIIIAGSDQIWNFRCEGFDKAYFLGFLHNQNKKNAYAASFGFSQIPEELKEEYLNRLKGFKNISVREHSGVRIIKNLLHREVSVCLDPTLLLSRKEWQSIAVSPSIKDKYILLYNVRTPKTMLDVARELGRKTGYKVIYINDYLKDLDIRHIRTCPPTEFLGWFQNATYVITNSFHGTVFSIIFQRLFLSELESADGGFNDRAKNLLTSLGISERTMNGNWETVIEKNIDWLSVTDKLTVLQKGSKDYLREIGGMKSE